MKTCRPYCFEYLLISAVIVLSATGFWGIYFADGASPNAFHHLHAATVYSWLFLLLYQLRQVDRGDFAHHRKIGLGVFLLGPLLFASSTVLTVHSASKALLSGQGDFLIVQNLMVTLELGLFILLAFVLRKRRKLHASLLLATTLLFMTIALFFSLMSFVPAFRIEGPETFHRFAMAAMTGSLISLVVGLMFFARDWRNGWPFLLAGLCPLLNEALKWLLTERELIQALTELAGSLRQFPAFVGGFALLFLALAATGVHKPRQRKTLLGGNGRDGGLAR